MKEVKPLGLRSRDFPKTFSKGLPMSDDLGIASKFFNRIVDGFLCVSKEVFLFLSL